MLEIFYIVVVDRIVLMFHTYEERKISKAETVSWIKKETRKRNAFQTHSTNLFWAACNLLHSSHFTIFFLFLKNEIDFI